MRGTYLIGVDIGTTGTKTVLLHETAGIVAQATLSSPIFSDGPAYAEADASAWVTNAVEGIRQVLAESEIDPAMVAAVSATGMVPAVICLDADLKPVRRPILQNDARATREIDELSAVIDGADMLSRTGSALTQQSVAPTVRWLQRNEPECWSATRYLVGSYDYVLIALGAPPHVEQNWALESGLYTLDGKHFEPALEAVDLSSSSLCEVYRPGTRIGTISASMAETTGLPADVALVVGGADHVLSAYAAGVDTAGDWLIKLGGAGDILTACADPIVDARLYLDAHPRQGTWLPNGCMATSGSLIRWFQTLIGGTPLTDLDAEAAGRRPAAVLCLPYFLGEKSPIHDPQLRGAFIGLELAHTGADMYRSVLEAIAFGFRHNAEVMRSAGITLSRARVTNGGSKSTLWKQIHADVLGTELAPVRDHPGASLGAAILAGVGAGVLGLDDAERFLQFDAPVVPDRERSAIYEEAYQLWRQAGDALVPISHGLTRRSR
ncbi:FGGY-family carbohydrate kinase [Mycolicibacterium neworleansense]|uniref:Carbohydrate kinase n=1 Tax=Mycolicibacterium neworleansense TaxID=146018 RepID=A0A0H5RNX7_9MYCO|nr:FGGY family carbohydrate kinase [Mycolicibacterium neworleansense]MCV7364401.1 carbohydrate kinase [Mycolicibacterium neworleansense]CRZ15187.1 carbohydrate kinase [Mycolicibacterium neworleansense]